MENKISLQAFKRLCELRKDSWESVYYETESQKEDNDFPATITMTFSEVQVYFDKENPSVRLTGNGCEMLISRIDSISYDFVADDFFDEEEGENVIFEYITFHCFPNLPGEKTGRAFRFAAIVSGDAPIFAYYSKKGKFHLYRSE